MGSPCKYYNEHHDSHLTSEEASYMVTYIHTDCAIEDGTPNKTGEHPFKENASSNCSGEKEGIVSQQYPLHAA